MIYQPPDRAQVERFLATRLPDVDDVTVTDIARSWPGMSRETWFVTAAWTREGTPENRRFVFRMDPPGGALGFRPLAYEAEVIRHLEPTTIPVPSLLWYVNDEEWFDGRDFFVRDLIDGVTEPPNLRDPDPRYDALRERVVRAHVEKLATLHTLDWEGLGFGEFMDVPSSPAHCAIEDLDWHLHYLRDHRVEPMPALVEAILWMRDNPPPAPARICLRKENNGLGEEIWDGDRIVAMSDWETASLGDPALDLVVATNTTLNLWSVDRALDYYEECSGIRIDAANLAYYQLIWAMRACVGLHCGLRNFGAHADQRLQLATLGIYVFGLQTVLAQAAGF